MIDGDGDGLVGADPSPRVFFLKNVKLKELYVEMMQECDSMALTGMRENLTELGGFRNGNRREDESLYTRQYSRLVNGRQMKVGFRDRF